MDKKTFVIVGAGKGLGNAVAKEFANHDFRGRPDCKKHKSS